MKTKLSILIGLAICYNLNAQIIYTSQDYSNVNDQMTYQNVNNINGFNFAQTGSNFTWDFNLVKDSENIVTITNPNTSQYKSIWCDKNNYTNNCNAQYDDTFNYGEALSKLPFIFGDFDLIENVYLHSQKNTSQISSKLYGTEIKFGSITIPTLFHYDLPDILYKFPMGMGDNYIEPYTIRAIFPSNIQNISINIDGIRENTVDGYGTLVIAGKTIENVLRLKSVNTQSMTFVHNGTSNNNTSVQVSYEWFSKSNKGPVLRVIGNEVGGFFMPTSVQFIDTDNVLASNEIRTKKLSVYPNPTKGVIKTNLIFNDIKNIEVYNTAGQLVHNSLDFTTLKKGIYILKINTNSETYTKTIIRE